MFKFLNKIYKPKKLHTYLGCWGSWHVDQIGMSRYYLVAVDNTDRFKIKRSSWDNTNGSIPELFAWCLDNDCSYGWDVVFGNGDTEPWESTDQIIGIHRLFIVTRDIETATLAKLIWCD